MILSILRSVPELNRNNQWVNKEKYIGGEVTGTLQKNKKRNYLTEALTRHCSGKSFILADDGILFSNTDMQHIQHYAYHSLLGKTPFCPTTKYILSREWFLNIHHNA